MFQSYRKPITNLPLQRQKIITLPANKKDLVETTIIDATAIDISPYNTTRWQAKLLANVASHRVVTT